MTAFSSPFGRLPTIRKRESKKTVQPINVDAAKQFNEAGPSSAASSLLTPRPHHFRSTTPSPATPSASAFASSSSSNSTRVVSSPTFVSSSALGNSGSSDDAFYANTPPLSPVALNTPTAAQNVRSPLRRALSRTFLFGGHHSASGQTKLQVPATSNATTSSRTARPARPSRPATSPGLSPDSATFDSTFMTRSQSSENNGSNVGGRRRSRTLLPPVMLRQSKIEEASTSLAAQTPSPRSSATSSARIRSLWGGDWSSPSSWSNSSSSPSPTMTSRSVSMVISSTDSSPMVASPSSTSYASPRTASLRSIRQMHARKALPSFIESPKGTVIDISTPEPPCSPTKTPTPAAPLRVRSRRLTRRASEESFHCRGLDFEPIAPIVTPAFYTRPSNSTMAPAASAPRPVSMYSSSLPSRSGSGIRRMSDFTRSSFDEAPASVQLAMEQDEEIPASLTGLGLTNSLPSAPRVMSKRLSIVSQVSAADSSVSLISSTSTVSLSSVEHLANESWPTIPTASPWFSACPPTPPSSIRLQLEFRSLPHASPALSTEPAKSPRPLSGIFISSNSSVLELKEAIVSRMHDLGYRISPKYLSMTLHLNNNHNCDTNNDADVCNGHLTALGLKFASVGQTPTKVLDDSSRLLFEEGAQEDDLLIVDCDPSHTLWHI